jgi:hypothetical protein
MGQQPGGGMGAGIFGGLLQGYIQGMGLDEQRRQRKYQNIMTLAAMHARLADEERAKPTGKPELVDYNTQAFFEHMQEAEKQLKPGGPGFSQIVSLFGLGKKKGKKGGDEEEQGPDTGGMEPPPGGGEKPTPTKEDAAAAAPGSFQMGSVTPAQEAPAIGGGKATFLTQGQAPPEAAQTSAQAPQQADTGALVGPPVTKASVTARERYGLDRLRPEETRPLGYYYKEDIRAKYEAEKGIKDQDLKDRVAFFEDWKIKNKEQWDRLAPEAQTQVSLYMTSPMERGMPALPANLSAKATSWRRMADQPNMEQAYNTYGQPIEGATRPYEPPAGVQALQAKERQQIEAYMAGGMSEADAKKAVYSDVRQINENKLEAQRLATEAAQVRLEATKIQKEIQGEILKAKQAVKGGGPLNANQVLRIIGFADMWGRLSVEAKLNQAAFNGDDPKPIIAEGQAVADQYLQNEMGLSRAELVKLAGLPQTTTPADQAVGFLNNMEQPSGAAPTASGARPRALNQ